MPVGLREPIVDRMVESAARDLLASTFVVGPTAFRGVGLPAAGGMTLITGGPGLTHAEWKSELAALRRFLREHADLLVYGYVRRGWAVSSFFGSEEFSDWPERANCRFATTGHTDQSFDDVFVPDAFGIQLLGADHADRVPTTSAWRRTPAGPSSLMLEHVDPGAWFDQPFWPIEVLKQRYLTPRPLVPEPPPVLVKARADFAPLLFTRDNLDRAGFETRHPAHREAT
jgi:hypothetical protein